jgi:hypothetical protein
MMVQRVRARFLRPRVFGAAIVAALTLVAMTVVVALTADGSVRPPAKGPASAAAAVEPGDFYAGIDVAGYTACGDTSKWIVPPQPPTPISGYLSGFGNAEKLGNALVVGHPEPALARSVGPEQGNQLGQARVGTTIFTCVLDTLELDHQGRRQFPPATATFVTFGFEPVTARVQLTQVGPDPLKFVLYLNTALEFSSGPFSAVATSTVAMRVDQVTVNGVPLDVGANCRTVAPLSSPDSPVQPKQLVLTGGSELGDPSPHFAHVGFGGTLAGYATIPPFTGCVSEDGEDLNKLMTATISGPDNYVRINLGPVCTVSTPRTCAPNRDPVYLPYWSVTNGGDYRATMTSPALTITMNRLPSGRITVTCDSTSITGRMPDTTGPLRGNLGTARLEFGACAGFDGSQWTVTQVGTGGIAGNFFDDGLMSGKLGDFRLRLDGTNVPDGSGGRTSCSLVIEGTASLQYQNPAPEAPAKLTLVPQRADRNLLKLPAETNTCAVVRSNADNQLVGAEFEIPSGASISSP